MKDIKKIKEFFSKPMKEIDVNDPVLMKARAAAFQRSQPKPELPKPVKTINPDYKAVKNADKIKALKLKRAQLMRDMEQEAEPEGGPIADRYGRELNKIDQAISMLSEAKSNPEVDSTFNTNKVWAFIESKPFYNKEYMPKFSTAEEIWSEFGPEDKEKYANFAWTDTYGDNIHPREKSALQRKANYDKLAGVKEIDANDPILMQTRANTYQKSGKTINTKKEALLALDYIEPTIREAEEEEETAIDMAKKQLDALGVKYELGNKFKPFKTIYKPTGKSDKFYDTFNDIVDLFNLKGVVKSSMNESNGFKSGKEFINIKLQNYPKAVAKINQLINMIGESNFTMEMAEWIFDFFNNASYESPVNEATEESYMISKSGSKSNPHYVLEKPDGSKQIDMMFTSPEEAKKYAAKKNLKISSKTGYNMNEAKEEDKVDTITMDIPLFIRMLEYSREDAAEDMDLHDVTEKAISLGKERGILQMDDYDEIIGDAEEIEENVAPNHNGKSSPYGSGYKPLEEKIAKALDQINEELCPAGKAYRKRRIAAGEKSSAYLSGRAVKVCKGQMSGKKKKK